MRNVNLNLSSGIFTMKFFIYLIISATTLLSFPNTAASFYPNPHQEHRGMAFPQSKDNLESLSLKDIRNVLTKVLQEVTTPLKDQKRDTASKMPHKHLHRRPKPCMNKEGGETKPRWARWTDWSSCSVSCGKGREIRWRHCLHNCAGVETEMEEKSCQLPACGGKLFGLIKL